ncbi:MAG: hypothetical protein WDW38_006719 [Sanguina aurantia]
MIYGRQSAPGTLIGSASRSCSGAYDKFGDAEEAVEAADYEESGKGIKGNMRLDSVSKEQLQQKLDGTRRGGAAIFLLLIFAVSMSVLQTSQVKLQVARQMATITALQERLEETGMELDDHRTEAIDFRQKLNEAGKEHEANEQLRSEIGGCRTEIATLRSDIGGLNAKLKEKTSIADRLWLENNVGL